MGGVLGFEKTGCYVGKKQQSIAFFLPFCHDCACRSTSGPEFQHLTKKFQIEGTLKLKDGHSHSEATAVPCKIPPCAIFIVAGGPKNSKSQPRRTQKHHQRFQEDMNALPNQKRCGMLSTASPPDPLVSFVFRVCTW